MTKDLCTYHQSKPAIWDCDECARHFCGQCVVVIGERPHGDPRCPLCEKRLEYLGRGNSSKPFWSVAHTFFSYPLSPSGIAIMMLAAALSLVMPFGLLGLIALIFTVAVCVKYCFAVLETVAMGASQAPSFAEATPSDEDHLFLKLVGILIVATFAQLAAGTLINPGVGTLLGLLFTLITPAVIMLLAISKQIGDALSPNRIVGLIVSLGWPYLLAVFLTNVISTGPYVVVEVFAEALFASIIALPVLAALITYFAIVNFAMLGYLLFEHQGNLGYITGDPDEERLPPTTDNLRRQLLGEVNVLAKENRHVDALKRFEFRRTEFADDMVYLQRYFDFARQCNDEQAIIRAGETYLELLMSKDAADQALDVWRDTTAVAGTDKPGNPATAHSLAERAYSKNLLKESLGLLVNLHQRAPQYAELGNAYQLAATVLREMGVSAKAARLEEFTRAFLQKRLNPET